MNLQRGGQVVVAVDVDYVVGSRFIGLGAGSEQFPDPFAETLPGLEHGTVAGPSLEVADQGVNGSAEVEAAGPAADHPPAGGAPGGVRGHRLHQEGGRERLRGPGDVF